MSWLASFEVLPSPNHVLAKLAIFRGAEPSPHSPRATDSQSLCSTIILNPSLSSSRSLAPLPPSLPLCPSRSPVSSPRSLPYHLCTSTPPCALLSSLWLTSPLTPPYFDLSSALFYSRSRAFDYDGRSNPSSY